MEKWLKILDQLMKKDSIEWMIQLADETQLHGYSRKLYLLPKWSILKDKQR